MTGMHRAGTSVLARATHLLRVDLGDNRWLLPADADNPGGYWEDNRVVQLDDQLLGYLGGWWNDPPELPVGWADDWRLEPFRVWGAQLIADRARVLEAGIPSGFKDPRLCLLLPFWRYVVAVDHTVVSVRDPREVVVSLVRRDDMTPEHAARLWLRYTSAAVVNAPDALAVRYEDWFRACDRTLALLAEHLGLAAPDGASAALMRDFVEPSLRRSAPARGTAPEGVVATAVAVYEALPTGPVAGVVPAMTEVLDGLCRV